MNLPCLEYFVLSDRANGTLDKIRYSYSALFAKLVDKQINFDNWTDQHTRPVILNEKHMGCLWAFNWR